MAQLIYLSTFFFSFLTLSFTDDIAVMASTLPHLYLDNNKFSIPLGFFQGLTTPCPILIQQLPLLLHSKSKSPPSD